MPGIVAARDGTVLSSSSSCVVASPEVCKLDGCLGFPEASEVAQDTHLTEAASMDIVANQEVINSRSVVKQQVHDVFLDQRALGMSPTSAAIEALHRCAKLAQKQSGDHCAVEAATPDMPNFNACSDMLSNTATPVMTC